METERIAALLAPFLAEPLQAAQLESVADYLRTLLLWNRRINLTAVRDPEHIVIRHFGESFFAAAHLFPAALSGRQAVIDVGSGAGFPGIPIRIYRPLALTLIESRQKKVAFLREVLRVLALTDAEVFAGRAEQYQVHGPAGHVTVTLRAVERFEVVFPQASRILAQAMREGAGSGRLALLIGAGQVSTAITLEPGLRWDDPVPTPLSHSRVLLVGRLQQRS